MTKTDTPNSKDLIRQLRSQVTMTKEERAKGEAILSSIGEGVISTDERGYVIQANQVALDILGYRKKELLGQWFPEIVPALNEDGSKVYLVDRPITRVFITGKAISERAYYRRKDGEAIPIALTISPMLLRNKPIGSIEVFRDITADIENEKMKTEFISIASHQLRTPLSSIYTYSHMLADGYAGNLNDNQLSFMNTIISASTRMNELITTLLNVTRLEAGNVTTKSEPTDFVALLEETVVELDPLRERKNIDLKTKLPPGEVIIKTDPLIVREIFTNLISNAIKYTPDSGLITVSLSKEGSNIVFCVKDTGYGIPAKAQPRIFTKFFRASNANQIETSGTGLGLYLIKILSEMINGEVWFTSRENYGSSFYFSISKRGSAAKQEEFSLESS